LHDVHDIRHEPDQSEQHSLSEDQCDGVLSGPLEFNFFGLRVAAHSSLQVDQPEGMALAACRSSLQSECKMALVTGYWTGSWDGSLALALDLCYEKAILRARRSAHMHCFRFAFHSL
jgi:hypothetical protein